MNSFKTIFRLLPFVIAFFAWLYSAKVLHEGKVHNIEVLMFQRDTMPVLTKVVSRIRILKKLEEDGFTFRNKEHAVDWYNISQIARREIREDLALLEKYVDIELQGFSDAKRLLYKGLSFEYKLWCLYEEFIRAKFEANGARTEHEILNELDKALFNFYSISDSLAAFYKRKLSEQEQDVSEMIQGSR